MLILIVLNKKINIYLVKKVKMISINILPYALNINKVNIYIYDYFNIFIFNTNILFI